jgi:hypothetical protein
MLNLLRAVPPDFGDISCDLGQELQLYAVDLSLRYHRPCSPYILGEVEFLFIDKTLFEYFKFYDTADLESSNAVVHARMAEYVPCSPVIEQVTG